MERWLLLFSVIIFIISVALIFVSYRKRREEARRLEEMIDAAIKGSFSEQTFDETVLSHLESRLADYLSGNEVSSKNLSEEKDKIKTLISDISHQTKTPIANLELYSELLAEADLTGESADYVRELQHQTAKLEFLISSLVKLSRLENGIMTYHPEEVSLERILNKLAESFSLRAEEKGLAFLVEPASAKAVCDEKWTLEAISNIVDNAIKYTDQGSIKISIRTFEMFTCVDIADTGCGIPEEEQANIFGRFYRGQKRYNNADDGVGIGLFLAREIISGQGGYIKVSSDNGGSTFSVFLPNISSNLSKL